MRTNYWTILLALSLVFASCSDQPEADSKPATRTISVSIGSGPKIDIKTESKTRTELGEDGVSVKWLTGDQIAFWAVNSQSERTIDNQLLKLWHYNAAYNTAKFTGDIPVMNEDTYTYYAVSPAPAETNGMTATFQIPALQNGAFNGAYDIMIAKPVEGPALKEGDNSETVQFEFQHMVHVLKIRIPQNNLGEKISEIALTFPQPVAGYMTVDVTDPSTQPILSSGSSTLKLRFDEPKDAGDVVFAIIAPTELSADQKITITATGATRQSRPREIDGKEFSAGHTTPIAYNIPKAGPTTLRFTLSNTGETTLGERISSLVLTGPEGSDLGNGSNVHIFTVDDTGSYDLVFEDFPEELSGQKIQVGYESENALILESFTIPTLKAGSANAIATLSVPYLLFEDFSALSESFSIHDNQATGINIGSGTDSGYTGSTDLSEYGLPAGWTAGRVGGQQGTSIRICGREEAGGKYPGRLDSAPLNGIKAGHTVTVSVSFNYSSDKKEYKGWGGKTGDTIYAYGYTTEEGAVNGNTGLHNTIESNIVLSTGGSYTNIPNSNLKTYTLSNCNSSYRLSWQANTNKASTLIQNGNYWLYLDNIKVSIVNE